MIYLPKIWEMAAGAIYTILCGQCFTACPQRSIGLRMAALCDLSALSPRPLENNVRRGGDGATGMNFNQGIRGHLVLRFDVGELAANKNSLSAGPEPPLAFACS